MPGGCAVGGTMGSTPSLVRDLCKQYDNRSIWAGVVREIQATYGCPAAGL
jgi:hypothetical protein